MPYQRRVSGHLSPTREQSERGISISTGGWFDSLSPAVAKRYALYACGVSVLLVAWCVMLTGSAGALRATVSGREDAIAEVEEQERACSHERDAAEDVRNGQKQRLRQVRRERNADAMRLTQEERACQITARELESVKKVRYMGHCALVLLSARCAVIVLCCDTACCDAMFSAVLWCAASGANVMALRAVWLNGTRCHAKPPIH